MIKKIKNISDQAGLPPGTLVHIGEAVERNVKISMIDYTETTFQEKTVAEIEDCFDTVDGNSVTWINIDGIHNIDIIQKIGDHFNLHSFLLEDILNTQQRPMMEDYDKYLFMILKMISVGSIDKNIDIEQVSILIGKKVVISFQEKEGDVFSPIRERIRNAKGRIRKMGADYLAYALIDAIVDNYFIIPEQFGEKIEKVEEELLNNPTTEILQVLHKMKRDMIFLRKAVWPLREVINNLERSESDIIKKSTGIYLRDVYDHTIQVADSIETFRDILSGMVDLYMSSISNKMNEVMKVLTIIATIFIPLTFIAGIYGMNFEYMPELAWRGGYFMVWGVIVLVTIGMLIYFKKKKWL
ncbi:MAG: magnesium/cobalt transporter CorA [Elusimicrobiota bacterium]